MTRLVLDASVVAKLYFSEEHSDRAERAVRRKRAALFAPDLLFAELANIAWKRVMRGEIDGPGALEIVQEATALPLTVRSSSELAPQALGLAVETGRTAYDCMYLALAIAERATMLTADRRFAEAVAGSSLARSVRWIGVDEDDG